MQKKTIAMITGLALMLVSTAALAAPSADTLLVSGYDADEMAVLYAVSGIDQEGDTEASLDCTIEGTYIYTLLAGEEGDTSFVVDSLEPKVEEGDDPGEPVEFVNETTVEGSEEGDPIAYGAEGAEECSLTSVSVGRDGKDVNHGDVVSTFAKLLKGGNGCLIRLFAQSDYGKKVDDTDTTDTTTTTTTVVEEDVPTEVTLSSIGTACDKGKSGEDKGKPDDKGQPEDKGKPENTGKPAVTGKDSAKGQNK